MILLVTIFFYVMFYYFYVLVFIIGSEAEAMLVPPKPKSGLSRFDSSGFSSVFHPIRQRGVIKTGAVRPVPSNQNSLYFKNLGSPNPSPVPKTTSLPTLEDLQRHIQQVQNCLEGSILGPKNNGLLLRQIKDLQKNLENLKNNPVKISVEKFNIFHIDYKKQIPVLNDGLGASVTGKQLTKLVYGNTDFYQHILTQREKKVLCDQKLQAQEIIDLKAINTITRLAQDFQAYLNSSLLLPQMLLDRIKRPEIQMIKHPSVLMGAIRELPKLCYDNQIMPLDCFDYLTMVLGPTKMTELGLIDPEAVTQTLGLNPSDYVSPQTITKVGYIFREVENILSAPSESLNPTVDADCNRIYSSVKIVAEQCGFSEEKVFRILQDGSFLSPEAKRLYHTFFKSLNNVFKSNPSQDGSFPYAFKETTRLGYGL